MKPTFTKWVSRTDHKHYWGQLTAVRYGGVTCRQGHYVELYQYSSANLPTRKEIRFTRQVDLGNNNYWDAPGTLVATYEYNNEGAMTALTYPNGTRYYYTRDTMARPTKLTTDVLATDGNTYPTDYVKDVVYGPAGELSQWKHVGGGTTDSIGRLLFN